MLRLQPMEGTKEARGHIPAVLRPRSSMAHVPTASYIGKNLITWPPLSVRKAGKYSAAGLLLAKEW